MRRTAVRLNLAALGLLACALQAETVRVGYREGQWFAESVEGEDCVVIPVAQGVFSPAYGLTSDRKYYEALNRLAIPEGSKVLVIGCGSGAATWAAWRKAKTTIYCIDINPMAVKNTEVVAAANGIEVRTCCVDVRDAASGKTPLPEDFGEFDFVLWNMPAVGQTNKLAETNYHDGDDGSILDAFVALLPKLLKADGQALIWNSPGLESRFKGFDVASDGIIYHLRRQRQESGGADGDAP
jgi:SAM-dependent methyltransferase